MQVCKDSGVKSFLHFDWLFSNIVLQKTYWDLKLSFRKQRRTDAPTDGRTNGGKHQTGQTTTGQQTTGQTGSFANSEAYTIRQSAKVFEIPVGL